MNFWRIDELKGGLNKILEASSKKRLTFFFRFTCFKGECVGNNGESHEVVARKQFCRENKRTLRHYEVRNRKNDFVCHGFR